MNYAEEYARRCVSADEAVRTVASGGVVDYEVFQMKIRRRSNRV